MSQCALSLCTPLSYLAHCSKFHGIYQQDDRDLRADRKRAGLEPAYSFMVRVRIPGGVCTPAQYINLDYVADNHANGTIRATTRQAVQVRKDSEEKIKDDNRGLRDIGRRGLF